ncbi:sensor histidine kinase [Candidatus Venteria ishoeyi]|uniref:histidine kinase n=1 Tax=Candidatus Venteria ishoeyi TaxID=1899563 RepID=A0A1H6F3E1_9GAMM|nr:ATP-binding protein [Candidatus Venteria ishoeyi]MDM8545209.1 ATP-binding protein [Candidatus Venteria ishoeyi]SEH04688.1 Signal transduction histidine-protein kinase BarA [Candidatus Venteria ishoeyi]
MKIQTKLFLLIFIILTALGVPIVLAGYYVMNQLIYTAHQQGFSREITHIKTKIEKDYQTLKDAGVADIKQYHEEAQETLLNALKNYEYGETGHLYVLTTDAKVLLHQGHQRGETFSPDFVQDMLNKQEGFTEYEYQDKDFIAAYLTSKEWNWLIVLEITKDEIFAIRSLYINFIGAVSTVIFLVLLLLSYVITRRSSLRIKGTLNYLKHVESGHIHAQSPEIAKDELGVIQRGINSMVEKITAVNLSMHHEIAQRRIAEDDMRQAKEEAIQANLTKSRFIANMSHELRTPLNAIIGYSEMLMEDLEENLEMAGDAEKIHNSGRHLLGLINDVLDISKIEAGKMEIHPEKFDLNSVLHEISDTVAPLIANKDNTLELKFDDNLGEVYTDLTKLRQILLNLLSNAAKFSEQHPIIFEAKRLINSHSDNIQIKVIDTGIGMNAEQQDKIFKAFTQADTSTTREYGGTGLGLAISRQFAIMIGGDIHVNSEVGVGSTFTLEMLSNLQSQQTLQ